MAVSSDKVPVSTRVREIAHKELERHVQDPFKIDLVKKLVQVVEDALNEDDLWIIQVVKELEKCQVLILDGLYGERTVLMRKQRERMSAQMKNHQQRVLGMKDEVELRRIRRQIKSEHEQMVDEMKEERRQFDLKLVKDMEETVKQQQETLVDNEVPGFKISMMPTDISLQKDILRFLLAIHAEFCK